MNYMGNSRNTSNELLFNEFIKEEALKPDPIVDVTIEIARTENKNYSLPIPVVLSEEEVKEQWRSIRNYFRNGQLPKGTDFAGLMPVLLAPYLIQEELTTDYPLFLSEEKENEHTSFSDLLDRTFKSIFKSGEAGILSKNLTRIENTVRKFVVQNKNFCSLQAALDPAFQELNKIKISGEDGVNFIKDLEKLKSQLPKSGKLIGFSQQTPVHLLAHLLKNQSSSAERKTFIAEVHRLKSGLEDLLRVNKGGNSKDQNLDFSNSFIEFTKLDKLMPDSASESMSGQRSERIHSCLEVLGSVESLLLKYSAIVFLGKKLADDSNFKWNELLPSIDIRIAPKNESCSSAAAGYKNHIAGLVKLMASVRIAALEIKGKYDEEIHGEYFSNFNWHYFTKEEAALCPPVILIEETQNLLGNELPHFSTLISSNIPVKVMALHPSLPVKIHSNETEADEMLSFQQELSAIAISHRNAYTLQSTVHLPIHMLKGIESGLSASSPALFHVMIPAELSGLDSGSMKLASQQFLDISASVEGRQFPIFTYNAGDTKWGSRFDISSNPQPAKDWPAYEIEVRNQNSEIEKLDLAFTFADFFAVNRLNANNLLVVDASYWTEDLIPLNEYLQLPSDKLYAKVPFIWLVDADNKLHKAAVPFSLVVAAKERLDYWNFIQELGGVNSFHVEQAVKHTREEMLEQKAEEIKKLQNDFEKQIEAVRLSAAGEAMNKLAGILLDLDSISTAPVIKTANESVRKSSTVEITPLENNAAPANTSTAAIEKETEASTEPWVETFRCTSCNECTDKYPRAFKYDGEKQAYLDDPTTITFAQLVKAAEACPAKCIHPGMPLNPNEPGLPELIAKAKKLN